MEKTDHITRKKIPFLISKPFRKYLKRYGREMALPIAYDTLKHFNFGIPVLDKDGNARLGTDFTTALTDENSPLENVFHPEPSGQQCGRAFVDERSAIASCNSKPFRIKIVNNFNEVYDYFYIKVADASRIFGMELEHLLSPYWMTFMVDKNTLVEEHISGVPGDMFIQQYLHRPEFNPKRIAKEFVKFNERCFIRLLGDMRSYNFIFDITQDFDDVQFKIRSIDFDQQFYGKQEYVPAPVF